MTKYIGLMGLLILLSACSSQSTLQTTAIPISSDPTATLTQVNEELTLARAERIDILAPTWFEKAEDSFNLARETQVKGGDLKLIFDALAESRAELSKAKEIAKISGVALEKAVKARQDALSAGAMPNTKGFKEAQERLLDLSREIENKNRLSSEDNRLEAEKAFREVELHAIKDRALTRPRVAMERAEKNNAEEIVPAAFEEAKHSIQDAENFIEKNRYDKVGIIARSDKAQFYAERADQLAITAKNLEGKKPEEIALEQENYLHNIRRSLGTEDIRNRPFQAQVSTIQNIIETIASENVQLKGKSTHLNSALENLQKKSEIEQRELAALQREKEFKEKYEIIRQRFSRNEAEVYQEGNKLILRLKGVTFPSGKADLSSANFPLLQKVKTAIQDFGSPLVSIEGHTDSVGTAEFNLELSKERANNVLAFFSSQEGVSTDYITAQGFGYERPIASNKTAEGRELNRRIDVIIEP